MSVAVGKWFTPGLGLRLQYNGLQAKGFTSNQSADYVRGRQLSGGYYKQRFDYMNLLSRKRGQAVADVLVHQYGIDAHRLKVDANGGVDQFGFPILNRVVLVKSAE